MEIGKVMELKNIALAFVKAKKEFAPAIKNSVNPHFRSKYADLATCIDAVNDAFLKNGIAMYQETFEDTAGVTIETVLLHESGESLRCGKLHVPASKADPQGYGSALSYCRRYSLLAACGIAAEDDDDGNAASDHSKPFQPRPAVQTPIQQTVNPTPPKPAYATTQRPPAAPPKPGCITSPQTARLHAIAKSNGKTYADLKEYIKMFGIESTSDMKRENYDAAIAWAEGKPVLVDESPIDDEQAF